MTRDELLDRAKGCIGWAGGNNYLAQPLPSIAVSLEAIACILLAREIGEGEVVKQAEAEAEQMVAAQMEEKPSGGHVLSDSELIRLRQWFEDYNHFLGDNISEGVMERIRRLSDSHRAANARIRELEEEHGVACCVRCGYPGQVYHYDLPGCKKRVEIALPYHPDELETG